MSIKIRAAIASIALFIFTTGLRTAGDIVERSAPQVLVVAVIFAVIVVIGASLITVFLCRLIAR